MSGLDISLYAIIDPARTRDRPLADLVKQAADGGATIFQYRDKSGDIRPMIDNCEAIKRALEPFGVPFLVNDRVDVALAVEADGVHLGQDDMPVEHARRLLGTGAVIGLTIKEIEHVEAAPIGTIDYACIGGVFATASKNNARAIGVEGWRQLADVLSARASNLPIGAIAGIDSKNAAELIHAGADGIAVISSIFMQDDVAAATRELKSIVEEGRR